MLHETKGNMYGWITHRWNPVRGECPHHCKYCYMTRWKKQKPIRFVDGELETDLGVNNTIFVVSGCDLFAEAIPDEWISKSLFHCSFYNNRYLFQSKNPWRMLKFKNRFPEDSILGTTIETNRRYPEMGETPAVNYRAASMVNLKKAGSKTMITIEPIMDFDLPELVGIVEACAPDWVNIGANTNHKVKLKEPDSRKVNGLIEEIRKFTEVKIKQNLQRLQ